MDKRYQQRSWIPAGLLLFYCLYSLFGLAARNASVDGWHTTNALPRGHIFEPARSVLAGVDEVGFVHIHHRSDTIPADSYLFQAQYALAPIRVDARLDRRVIVGHFATNSAMKKFIAENRVEVVSRFPRGVVVFTNSAFR